MLAAMYVLLKFKTHTYGNVVHLFVDSKALYGAFYSSDPGERILRFITRIANQNILIHWVPGKENHIADTISRVPFKDNQFPKSVGEEIAWEEDVPGYEILTRSRVLILETEKDGKDVRDDYKRIKAFFEPEGLKGLDAETRIKVQRRALQFYKGEGGIMKRAKFGADRLYPPPEKWESLIEEIHNIGHFGQEGCYRLISNRFYWPMMRAHVLAKIAECDICQRFSPKPEKYRPLRIPRSTIFVTVASDVLGPLPKSNGKTYVFFTVDFDSRIGESEDLAMVNEEKTIRQMQIRTTGILDLRCCSVFYFGKGSQIPAILGNNQDCHLCKQPASKRLRRTVHPNMD